MIKDFTKFDLVNKIKSTIENCDKNYQVNEVDLDSCDTVSWTETEYDDKPFNFRGQEIAVLKVTLDGLKYIEYDKYGDENEEDLKLISWEESSDFDEIFLKEILNNLKGTISNEIK